MIASNIRRIAVSFSRFGSPFSADMISFSIIFPKMSRAVLFCLCRLSGVNFKQNLLPQFTFLAGYGTKVQYVSGNKPVTWGWTSDDQCNMKTKMPRLDLPRLSNDGWSETVGLQVAPNRPRFQHHRASKTFLLIAARKIQIHAQYVKVRLMRAA